MNRRAFHELESRVMKAGDNRVLLLAMANAIVESNLIGKPDREAAKILMTSGFPQKDVQATLVEAMRVARCLRNGDPIGVIFGRAD